MAPATTSQLSTPSIAPLVGVHMNSKLSHNRIFILGIQSVWTSWSGFGPCSEATCGDGFYTRTRICAGCVGTCDGNSTDIQPCSSGAPKSWTDWAASTNCSTTCGTGYVNRTRQCTGCSGSCIGPSDGQLSCTAGPNVTWSDWSPWSQCSQSCGGGVTFQNRTCDGCVGTCQGSTSSIQPCNTQNCRKLGVCGFFLLLH